MIVADHGNTDFTVNDGPQTQHILQISPMFFAKHYITKT